MSPVAPATNETDSVGTRREQVVTREDQFVSFWVDGQLLGVPVRLVQEVLNPQLVTRTPLARPEVKGLLNLRGQIVTAVDLRIRLGLEEAAEEVEQVNVVIRHQDESYSFLADEVGDVIMTSGLTIEPVPHTLDPLWKPLVQGIFRLDDRLFIILDIKAVLKLE